MKNWKWNWHFIQIKLFYLFHVYSWRDLRCGDLPPSWFYPLVLYWGCVDTLSTGIMSSFGNALCRIPVHEGSCCLCTGVCVFLYLPKFSFCWQSEDIFGSEDILAGPQPQMPVWGLRIGFKVGVVVRGLVGTVRVRVRNWVICCLSIKVPTMIEIQECVCACFILLFFWTCTPETVRMTEIVCEYVRLPQETN